MPRIPQNILDCAIYLYPSADDAKRGYAIGGSGFLIGVRTEYKPGCFHRHEYAVTNSHVVRTAGGAPAIRLNNDVGGFDVLKTDTLGWIHHVDADDLAVYPVDLSQATHRYFSVEVERLITKDWAMNRWAVPGIEVFMVGRFIGHDGKQRNTPSLRFGNIAQMPNEPILNEAGIRQESFLIEMRSLGGCSGSPVLFWHDYLEFNLRWSSQAQSKQDWYLLGVDWCHIKTPHYEAVMKKVGQERFEATNFVVAANSGMAGVVPAWKLKELLESDVLERQRRERDAQGASEKGAVAEFDSPQPG